MITNTKVFIVAVILGLLAITLVTHAQSTVEELDLYNSKLFNKADTIYDSDIVPGSYLASRNHAMFSTTIHAFRVKFHTENNRYGEACVSARITGTHAIELDTVKIKDLNTMLRKSALEAFPNNTLPSDRFADDSDGADYTGNSMTLTRVFKHNVYAAFSGKFPKNEVDKIKVLAIINGGITECKLMATRFALQARNTKSSRTNP